MCFRGASSRERSRLEVLFASAIWRFAVCLFVELSAGGGLLLLKRVPVYCAAVMFWTTDAFLRQIGCF